MIKIIFAATMTHNRFRAHFLAGVILVLGSGCSNLSSSSSDDNYQPPAPGRAAAYLKGSNFSEGGLFGTDHRVFAFMVDMQWVRDAADQWDHPLALAPGHHTIGVEYSYSNFIARADVSLEAKPGVTYQIMLGDGHEDGPDARLFCEFWIVDKSTGKAVTQVYHRQVTGGKKGTIFNVNK